MISLQVLKFEYAVCGEIVTRAERYEYPDEFRSVRWWVIWLWSTMCLMLPCCRVNLPVNALISMALVLPCSQVYYGLPCVWQKRRRRRGEGRDKRRKRRGSGNVREQKGKDEEM
ncbi:hypothetical protein KSS87_003217 [Heliosperma pusillum]|nr:hypothetical protein KSS87_003217 [Heliosperma pusillum]